MSISLNRRRFLAISSAGAAVASTGIEGVIAAQQAPAFAQGTKLHIVRWVDFIPEADVELKRQAPEASKALGAEVTFEFINANDLQPRITAAIQSGSGADIFQMLWNWPHLYANGLIDVSDIAEPIGKSQGGFYDAFPAACKVGGRWLAVPHATGGNAVAYRKSWHAEIGLTEFPKTWDAWREAGKKLKAKGKPIGQALGHSFGDPPGFSYPLLWSFGGAETDASGKKVVLNSKGTVESVKFMQAFWKDSCDEGGLAWDDTNNNRAFHAGEISATLNGASIYIVAKRQQDKIKDEKGEPLWRDIDHAAPLPAGPAGAAALYATFEHAIMKYSKNQKVSKDFLTWLAKPENYGKWFEVNEGYTVGAAKMWEENPMWGRIDKPLQIFRRAARHTRTLGYQGPPTAKATESYSKYIIVDMYAKACQGTKAEEAVRWAESELKKIYEG
jgi:multiple sugar transport system substrate-binding protein